MTTTTIRRLAIPLGAALLLAGCAGFSRDGGMEAVSEMTKARTGHRLDAMSPASAERTRELLAAPLGPDTAAEIALLNNRGLRAALAELGIAEADLVQAGRLRNPGVTFGRLRGGGETEIERRVTFDLAGLLTLPLRQRIEQGRFERAQLEAATSAVELAYETRRAWFEAVAAQQTAQYMEQVRLSAEAGAELAQRMARVGNWSKLDQDREQVFYAEATAQLARARQQAYAARERLARLLGTDAAFTLPDRLPDLPAQPREAAGAEATAIAQRLDVAVAKRDVEDTARALGLTRATRFVNVLEAGYANRSETGAPRRNGYEVSLELPLFDWSGAHTAKAEAVYMQSVHRAADVAVRARSEARVAHHGYRMAYDAAVHYRDQVMPLRRRISDEVLRRYNGMLASVFELLADAREQIAGVNAAIEAQRDYWIAETNLQAALHGAGSKHNGKD